MILEVGDIIKWRTTKTIEYGYVTKIDQYDQYVYVRWFYLDYDQRFSFSTAKRQFKKIS